MTWNEVLMYIINTVFKIIITVAIPYAFNLVTTKIKGDMQKKYLQMFEDLVRNAVQNVQQTYVAHMKAENLFDEEAQNTAFKMVKDSVLTMMNDETKKIVMEAVGDFETFVNNKIESEVYVNKVLATGVSGYLAEAKK